MWGHAHVLIVISINFALENASQEGIVGKHSWEEAHIYMHSFNLHSWAKQLAWYTLPVPRVASVCLRMKSYVL